jgi:hypothetical protein
VPKISLICPIGQPLKRRVVATMSRNMCAVTGLGNVIATRKRRNQVAPSRAPGHCRACRPRRAPRRVLAPGHVFLDPVERAWAEKHHPLLVALVDDRRPVWKLSRSASATRPPIFACRCRGALPPAPKASTLRRIESGSNWSKLVQFGIERRREHARKWTRRRMPFKFDGPCGALGCEIHERRLHVSCQARCLGTEALGGDAAIHSCKMLQKSARVCSSVWGSSARRG